MVMEHRDPYLHLDLGPELGVVGERGDFSTRFLRGLSKALGGSFPLPSSHSAVSEKSRPFPIIKRKGGVVNQCGEDGSGVPRGAL